MQGTIFSICQMVRVQKNIIFPSNCSLDFRLVKVWVDHKQRVMVGQWGSN